MMMGAVLLIILVIVLASAPASSGQDAPACDAVTGAASVECPDSTGAPVAEPAPGDLVSCPGWLAGSPGGDGGFLIDLPEWLEALASGGLAERLTGLDDLEIRLSPRRIVLGTGFDFCL